MLIKNQRLFLHCHNKMTKDVYLFFESAMLVYNEV